MMKVQIPVNRKSPDTLPYTEERRASCSRKIAVLGASLMLILMMAFPSATFAESGQADPIQNNSNDTATIYVGKVLTVAQDNKFPTVTDFNFRLEAVKAWDNANVNTALSGKDISIAEMPLPTPVPTEHKKITLTGNGAAEIQVGNFGGNPNTAVADTAREKYRSVPVNIRFTKAGYYMYKITELSSVPEAIPGMAYDNNGYYAVVYVCNKTDDKGNTIPGVYVHDITSYRNNPDTDVQPNLSDIQNVEDYGGNPAAANEYQNFEKVGKTPDEPGTDDNTGNPVGPNKLEAYRFFNDQTTHDVVVTNNVTGNLGDITKEFEYTVTLSGLEKNKQYTTGIDAQDKSEKKTTSATAEILSAAGGKGSIDSNAKTFTSDSDGNAVFMIKLANDEVMVFNALPATSKYQVEEHASDHIASYTSESTEPDTWIMGTPSRNNTVSGKSVSTDVETVDAVSNVPGRDFLASEDNDGTVTINFINHRDLLTPTGIPYFGEHVYVLAAIAGALIVFFLVRRKSEKEDDLI